MYQNKLNNIKAIFKMTKNDLPLNINGFQLVNEFFFILNGKFESSLYTIINLIKLITFLWNYLNLYCYIWLTKSVELI